MVIYCVPDRAALKINVRRRRELCALAKGRFSQLTDGDPRLCVTASGAGLERNRNKEETSSWTVSRTGSSK
jgi:hypothetical protein